MEKGVPIDERQSRDAAVSMPTDTALVVRPEQSEKILGIRESLRILRRTSPRQAEIIQLHFYGGLTYEEIAATLQF